MVRGHEVAGALANADLPAECRGLLDLPLPLHLDLGRERVVAPCCGDAQHRAALRRGVAPLPFFLKIKVHY